MIEPKKWEMKTLIRCEDDECSAFIFLDELGENDWKCTHCGKSISKPE